MTPAQLHFRLGNVSQVVHYTWFYLQAVKLPPGTVASVVVVGNGVVLDPFRFGERIVRIRPARLVAPRQAMQVRAETDGTAFGTGTFYGIAFKDFADFSFAEADKLVPEGL